MRLITNVVGFFLWLAVGVGIVVLAVPLTGFQAASPWRYSVQATGNIESTGEPALGTPEDPIRITAGEFNESGEIGTMRLDESLDLGVLSFLVIVYVGGTLMGRVLKRRPKAKSFTAS